MEISVKSLDLATQKSPCIVAGVYDNHKLTPSAKQLDDASGGYLSKLLKRKDLQGNPGDTLLLHDVPNLGCERLMLVGCGKATELNHGSYKKIINAAVTALKKTSARNAIFSLCDLDSKTFSHSWQVRAATENLQLADYAFDELKKDKNKNALKKIIINVTDKRAMKKAELAQQIGQAIGQGANLARDLGNLPGNVCTPTYLANQAKKLGSQYKKLKITVLGQAEIEKLKMGSFLSVAKGSRQPPKFIIMEHHGAAKSEKPYVLVGKGITFDSGGISIKPGAAMDEMKFDMCGAASVIGTMATISELELPINVVGIVPSCENLPDGAASKPGDIVTSMSGQTIEVLNTDAEGRLILCDALTYSEKYHPKAVIDVATLTGACVIALGKHPAGLLSNNQPLADQILKAGNECGDRAWQMPLWEEYQEQLKSNFADMANIGGRDAGTITAACFLARFTKAYHWAHLDIAGVAWDSGANKGATGRPVALLSQYLLDRCGSHYKL